MPSQALPVNEQPSSHWRQGGPYFDDLAVGDRYASAGMTLTDGLAATHQAILGNRLSLTLDAHLSRRVTDSSGRLANPALVWDVAIGQTTHFSQRAKANLFYRGLALRRFPVIGDTLYTTAEVVALRENTRREGRYPTGMVALRITSVDQDDRVILDFARCAMLPLSGPDATTGHNDELSAIAAELDLAALRDLVTGWKPDPIAGSSPAIRAGDSWTVESGDVVTSAPELARLTLNLAAVHHDYRAAGGIRRLVYGGHTIGLAAAQISKTLPGVLAILGWQSCDHLAPVYEDDTLFSSIEVEDVEPLTNGAKLVQLRSVVHKAESADSEQVDVLDWRFIAIMI
jgi:acyl dehydratase